MLWTVRHRWASMARFTFNMHRHFVRLVLRRPGKSPYIILSKEGVIQGDPTSSYNYGIGLLPLGERVNSEHPGVASPAIADDWTLAGRAKDCAKALATICRLGPSVGYFAEAEKSYCIVAEKDEAAAKALHAAEGCNVQFTRGQRYVGGFVGGKAEETSWLAPQVDKWVEGVKALARVAWRYPQTAYAGLVWCLQAEWQYLCRVLPGVGEHLRPIEVALRKEFIPAVLGHKGMVVSDDARKLYANGVKQGGLAIRVPHEQAEALHEVSMQATVELVAALLSGGELDLPSHRRCVKKASSSARDLRIADEEAFLHQLGVKWGKKFEKKFERMGENGAWLTRLPSNFDGTVLTREEWHDNVSIRYGFRPTNLPQQCDGCRGNFTVGHALTCKKGGLVVWRHNDARDEWEWLCKLALPDSSVGTEPFIFYGVGLRAGQEGDGQSNNQGGDEGGNGGGGTGGAARNNCGDEARGDVSARGFWSRRRVCIFDLRITDTDANSYSDRKSAKVLANAEKEKEDKYGKACRDRQRDFTPMVYSVDGMPGNKAKTAERRLAALLAVKWKREYSDVVNFVRVRMALAIVRSNSLLLRTERDKGVWKRRAPMDSAACLSGRGMSNQ